MAPEMGGRKRREAKSRCRILYWHLRITLWDQHCLMLFCMLVGGANFECLVGLAYLNQGPVYQNYQQYDKILLIRDGKVVEFDTPRALLARSSEFRLFYEAKQTA